MRLSPEEIRETLLLYTHTVRRERETCYIRFCSYSVQRRFRASEKQEARGFLHAEREARPALFIIKDIHTDTHVHNGREIPLLAGERAPVCPPRGESKMKKMKMKKKSDPCLSFLSYTYIYVRDVYKPPTPKTHRRRRRYIHTYTEKHVEQRVRVPIPAVRMKAHKLITKLFTILVYSILAFPHHPHPQNSLLVYYCTLLISLRSSLLFITADIRY